MSAVIAPPPQAVNAGCTLLSLNETFTKFTLQPDGISYAGDSGLWYSGFGFSPPPPPASIVWAGSGALQLTAGGCLTTIPRTYWPNGPGPGMRTFLHGYFEASFKLLGNVPAGPNNWAAFWLFSAKHMLVAPDPAEWSEIDIFESGFYPGYAAAVHDWHLINGVVSENPPQNPAPNTWANIGVIDLTKPHIFGCLWQNGFVEYYLDNTPVQRSVSSPINDTDPCAIILSCNTGNVQFDWVRVWSGFNA